MFEELNRGISIPSPKVYREMSPLKRREMRDGLFYISPCLLGFVLFTLLPIIASLIFSFTSISITDGILSKPNFVGFANYKQLATDPQIWAMGSGTSGSLWITVKFALIALPVGIFLPLGIAVLMNSPHLRGSNFFRSAFYMPYIVPFVAAIFVGWYAQSRNGLD